MAVGTIDDSTLQTKWESFVEERCAQELATLEANYPTKRSLIVKYPDVQSHDHELADFLIEKPDITMMALEKVIKKPQAGVLDIPFEPHARITEVPENNLLIQNISSNHLEKLIAIKGVVTKRADVRHKVHVALYKCLMCEHIVRVPIVRKVVAPEVCPECRRRSLKLDEESSYFVDIQRAELQELLERLTGGTPAARLELYMEDDMVNTLTPGDPIEICGIVRLRPPAKSRNQKRDDTGEYSRYMEVISITSMSKDFEDLTITPDEERRIRELSKDPKIYEHVRNNIAPGIYGHNEVKDAIALQMFGGTKNKFLPGGEPIRDDVHLLLIGDPGSAKTRLLQYARDLVPKGIYVSGKTVTGVGLTAAAEKDELGDGGWTLKAGALVLASGGMAAVDEFDKIDDTERAAMHEVMESQTVSIAKAGIVAKFRAKCAILAAANPKFGRFNRNQLPSEQFDIPPTLLSRFDLIFVIFDTMDKVRDSELAGKILANHQYTFKDDPGGKEALAEAAQNEIMDRKFLTKYISYAKRTCSPKLTNEAAEKIRDFYVELRTRGAQAGTVPITPRQIEGIIRMSEASAKLRLAEKVEAIDAERAIGLLNFMMNELAKDKETGLLDIDIITTGKPKSQVDKFNNIMGIIQQMQSEFDMVEINKIIEAAAELHVNEVEARRIIDEMIYKGELYKVKHGFVKIVKEYG